MLLRKGKTRTVFVMSLFYYPVYSSLVNDPQLQARCTNSDSPPPHQTLKELLEEEQEATLPYLGTDDASMEQRRSSPEVPGAESALERVLGDLLAVSKRSWSRFKKGGLRSCFGVRLERIGSFSGLGC